MAANAEIARITTTKNAESASTSTKNEPYGTDQARLRDSALPPSNTPTEGTNPIAQLITAPPTPAPVAIRAERCPRNATNPLTTSIAIDKNKSTTVSTLLAGRAARQHVLLDAAGCVEALFLRFASRDQFFEFRTTQYERAQR